jgi:hypothetical protein
MRRLQYGYDVGKTKRIGEQQVSDYKDYEVRVSYDGGIYVSALNQEEAIEIAKNIMLEETNPDMAKYLTYEVKQTILKQVQNA